MEGVPKWVPLNTDLLFNPINWLIIILMVTIAAIAVSFMLGAAALAGQPNQGN